MKNFGKNQEWQPARVYTPRNEEEVLEILQRHPEERVRATGALHSWSPAPVADEILLNLSRLNSVELRVGENGQTRVSVGAGCTIQYLLDRLRAQGFTLPSMGAIKRQTVSGATATGTHGSGKPSLSSFVTGVTLATFDSDTGKPAIVTYTEGPELLAARCSLGCLGIVLRLEFEAVPLYLVRETTLAYDRVESIIEEVTRYPLSFFILIPHRWSYVIWRREPQELRPLTVAQKIKATLYRLLNYLGSDVTLHFVLIALMRGSSVFGWKPLKTLLHLFPKLMPIGQSVVDDAEEILTLAHDFYRHEEMEVFVPADELTQATQIITEVTAFVAGDGELTDELCKELAGWGLLESLQELRGDYVHHYPLVFRNVLGEETLMAMASGKSAWFSISFFTYADDRQSYYRYCAWMAECLVSLFGARLHWGKHFPLEIERLAKSYPGYQEFAAQCRKHDPQGRFTNEFFAPLRDGA